MITVTLGMLIKVVSVSSKVYIARMAKASAKGRRNRVRGMRLARDLTQAELAAAIGVSRQTVVAIEAGDYAPSVYLALAVAAVLGETVESLFAVPPDDATGVGPQEVGAQEVGAQEQKEQQ